MNKSNLCSISPLLLLLAFTPSCSEPSHSKAFESNIGKEGLTQNADSQVAEYVVEIFEDKKGDLWFGTMAKGAARYDGKTLTYFTTNEGLSGNTVASIAEDKEGNLWFGTHSGLSKYDGKTFTNFTTEDGLCHDRVSNILIDRAGNMWIGTWGGVCQYNLPTDQADGSTFFDFPIPLPDIDAPTNEATKNWVTEIMEDKEGNIWFGRDGYGACKYNPATGDFTHFTKKDGLPSNNIQAIHEDRQGNIWFGSRVAERDNADPSQRSGEGGLSRYDSSDGQAGGNHFIQYPTLEGLSKNDIYTIYEDKTGNIWIGATGYGAYRYDGEKFTVFKEIDRMDLTAGFGLQAALEDKNGVLWFGFSGGLFRFNGTSIVNVTQDGPWK